eukprot:8684669-Pyramimonas_sp.AAC.1
MNSDPDEGVVPPGAHLLGVRWPGDGDRRADGRRVVPLPRGLKRHRWWRRSKASRLASFASCSGGTVCPCGLD